MRGLIVIAIGAILVTACAQREEVAANVRRAATEGQLCSGIAGISCGDGLYCAMEVGKCAMTDASGTCQKKPQICTFDYSPVCGCDRKTYSNACSAAAAGTSVLATGECPSDGNTP